MLSCVGIMHDAIDVVAHCWLKCEARANYFASILFKVISWNFKKHPNNTKIKMHLYIIDICLYTYIYIYIYYIYDMVCTLYNSGKCWLPHVITSHVAFSHVTWSNFAFESISVIISEMKLKACWLVSLILDIMDF